ncbi:uncharacterized protein LY89DRAFT_585728 [Mollisia scopiformis]|uniref:Uncharacterized protein n=1 Tax=Mollisia scopiformis TaxID=149040 RepID=A0A194X9M3_MOLSC|nr:uncharacterized protein LY89DRAFT_585728 [Mollisia scopiformis]KUJ16824.1 hypothetical protein LY89DRAFT_585728 [Mollisia scopiformis]
MCHQVIQIFECGHNHASKVVQCKRPTDKCNGVFLRQDLQDTRGLCVACRRTAKLKRAQQKEAAVAAEDEGYWS